MIFASRRERKAAEARVRSWPAVLSLVPKSEWAPVRVGPERTAVWRSRDYLVQAFDEVGGVVRLSINRTRLLSTGHWDDGLTWDELQEIKRQCGYGDRFAVEIYPEDSEVINVANMRHLWVLPAPITHFGWRRS